MLEKYLLKEYSCCESYERYRHDEIQKDKLIKKPEILMYGRIVHQKRDVGFFSDESKGYYYSGKFT